MATIDQKTLSKATSRASYFLEGVHREHDNLLSESQMFSCLNDFQWHQTKTNPHPHFPLGELRTQRGAGRESSRKHATGYENAARLAGRGGGGADRRHETIPANLHPQKNADSKAPRCESFRWPCFFVSLVVLLFGVFLQQAESF